MRETNTRSLAKAISWRVIATSITFSIAYMFTGEITVALEIGALDMVIKLIAYFFHERIWVRINIGKILNPLSHIVLKPGIDAGDVMKKLNELEFIDEKK